MDVQPGMTAAGRPRVLLVTLRATGGVAALVEATQGLLAERGWRADLAWYEPYRQSPDFSVPLFALPFRRPRLVTETQDDGTLLHRVGVRLPELEAMRYRPTRLWRQVLADYDLAIAVCGSVLPAGVFQGFAGAALAWVATPFDADRELRRQSFPWPRRLLDDLVDAPLCRRLERRLLGRVPCIAISRYSRRFLERLQPAARVLDVVPPPLDLEECAARPWPASGAGRRVGFFGRHADPRKNMPLLLRGFALLRRRRPDSILVLAGEEAEPPIRRMIAGLGLDGAVELHGRVPRAELLRLHASLDLFVIPSQQEGLCISGIEAMASGRPVLSTRCGGPEDYVIEGETGWFTEADPAALAERLDSLLADPALLRAAGARARAFVARHYDRKVASQAFHAVLDRLLAARPALARG